MTGNYSTAVSSVKSALDAAYAQKTHTHSAYVNPTIADNLNTNDATQVLSAKQGKVLNDLIGNAITYINQQVVIKITNDTSTLNGALTELGETMASNLVAMGVTGASASDGLTTLAGKILDIEPSVGGLDLTSEMSLSASSNSISLGQSVVLTATLTANYDDETLVNVDLHGYLQGATVSFKNGDTVIDTATTDVNGVASYTYTPSSAGTLSLTAVFAGTDNFSSATSSSVSVVVSAPTVASVSLSADKSVLSYYHSESATLSATVLDSDSSPVESATVEFFKGSTSLS